MYLDSTMILILIFVYNILIFRVCLIHIKNAKTELIKKQNAAEQPARSSLASYPVLMTYPMMGAASFCLGLVHDNVIDLDVNPVTIGRPGELGTSGTNNFKVLCKSNV